MPPRATLPPPFRTTYQGPEAPDRAALLERISQWTATPDSLEVLSWLRHPDEVVAAAAMKKNRGRLDALGQAARDARLNREAGIWTPFAAATWGYAGDTGEGREHKRSFRAWVAAQTDPSALIEPLSLETMNIWRPVAQGARVWSPDLVDAFLALERAHELWGYIGANKNLDAASRDRLVVGLWTVLDGVVGEKSWRLAGAVQALLKLKSQGALMPRRAEPLVDAYLQLPHKESYDALGDLAFSAAAIDGPVEAVRAERYYPIALRSEQALAAFLGMPGLGGEYGVRAMRDRPGMATRRSVARAPGLLADPAVRAVILDGRPDSVVLRLVRGAAVAGEMDASMERLAQKRPQTALRLLAKTPQGAPPVGLSSRAVAKILTHEGQDRLDGFGVLQHIEVSEPQPKPRTRRRS